RGRAPPTGATPSPVPAGSGRKPRRARRSRGSRRRRRSGCRRSTCPCGFSSSGRAGPPARLPTRAGGLLIRPPLRVPAGDGLARREPDAPRASHVADQILEERDPRGAAADVGVAGQDEAAVLLVHPGELAAPEV